MCMLTDRRDFIKWTAAGLALLPQLQGCTIGKEHSKNLFLTACDDQLGNHFVTGFDDAGRTLFYIPVSQRAHGVAVNPRYRADVVFFSRRPGTSLHKVNIANGTLLSIVDSGAGRHFYGHGCYASDGSVLYVTENDYKSGRGIITVRDAASLKTLHEFPSYGIGPHELHFLPDGKTLVVANGGIETHPSRPREKLNLGDMQPSLVYIDAISGKLIDEYRTPNSQLSIRHLDVNRDGIVGIAMQYEGDPKNRVSLIATHKGERQLQLFDVEDYQWNLLQHYCGSVTFANLSKEARLDIAAVSSPRGGRLMLCDFLGRKVLRDYSITDVCGVAYSDEKRAFIATTGSGKIYQIDVSGENFYIRGITSDRSVRWDNHLLSV